MEVLVYKKSFLVEEIAQKRCKENPQWELNLYIRDTADQVIF